MKGEPHTHDALTLVDRVGCETVVTLADVAGEAGLSQGIVNLHLKSKDNLLSETLRYCGYQSDPKISLFYR